MHDTWSCAFFMIFGVALGFMVGADYRAPAPPNRALVIECMSEIGFEAADPSASRLEQLDQAQTWCEQFLTTER